MRCDESRVRVGALVDRELDVVRSLEIEAHVATCANCARALVQQQEVRAAFNAMGCTGSHVLGGIRPQPNGPGKSRALAPRRQLT